jgi:hypothetical protein
MGDKFFINGHEILAIEEGDLEFSDSGEISHKKNFVERDCEINTIYGAIHFRAVFTEEQWAEFIKVSEMVGEK